MAFVDRTRRPWVLDGLLALGAIVAMVLITAKIEPGDGERSLDAIGYIVIGGAGAMLALACGADRRPRCRHRAALGVYGPRLRRRAHLSDVLRHGARGGGLDRAATVARGRVRGPRRARHPPLRRVRLRRGGVAAPVDRLDGGGVVLGRRPAHPPRLPRRPRGAGAIPGGDARGGGAPPGRRRAASHRPRPPRRHRPQHRQHQRAGGGGHPRHGPSTRAGPRRAPRHQGREQRSARRASIDDRAVAGGRRRCTPGPDAQPRPARPAARGGGTRRAPRRGRRTRRAAPAARCGRRRRLPDRAGVAHERGAPRAGARSDGHAGLQGHVRGARGHRRRPRQQRRFRRGGPRHRRHAGAGRGGRRTGRSGAALLRRIPRVGPTADQHGGGLIRVALADDQALVRAGFRVLIDAEDDIEVVGEADDGAQAIEVVQRTRPDVVLMDIRMPELDGLEATRRIVADEANASVRVLILTTFEVDEYVFEALRAGASGFLVKDTEPAELVRAVRVVADGESLLSPGVTRRLVAEFVARPERAAASPPSLSVLTDREREVMALVAAGLSNDEIAEELFVSPATARTHVSRAMVKLNARDRAQLVVAAYESGLVTPGSR